MLRNILGLVLLVTILTSCEKKSNLSAPRDFFSENKIGSSIDYAVVKWGDPEDHVVTVHGFMDDLKSCQLIVEALNKDACSDTAGNGCLNPFSCQPLNL